MSVPASEMGGVGSVDNTSTVAPTASTTPATGTSVPNFWLQGLSAIPGASFLSNLNPFSGNTAFLPNATLVVVGIVLALGALLISQKQTTITVASRAVEAVSA